jgi:hypothetical protein
MIVETRRTNRRRIEMSKSSSKSKNGGKRENKSKSISLKDLDPKKGVGKVKGGTVPGGNGGRKSYH